MVKLTLFENQVVGCPSQFVTVLFHIDPQRMQQDNVANLSCTRKKQIINPMFFYHKDWWYVLYQIWLACCFHNNFRQTNQILLQRTIINYWKCNNKNIGWPLGLVFEKKMGFVTVPSDFSALVTWPFWWHQKRHIYINVFF